MDIFLVILGFFVVTISVILIYDARILTKKLFSFQDINEGTKTLKIIGCILFVLGCGIIYVYFPDAINTLENLK